jgi:hypothetical protein
MPLIEELQISLKDLWPEPTGGKLIRDRSSAASAVVSGRLLSRMMNYAADKQIDLASVIDQLRDEIHQR